MEASETRQPGEGVVQVPVKQRESLRAAAGGKVTLGDRGRTQPGHSAQAPPHQACADTGSVPEATPRGRGGHRPLRTEMPWTETGANGRIRRRPRGTHVRRCSDV